MYKKYISSDAMTNNIVVFTLNGLQCSFIEGCGNQDDMEYQEWLQAGNEPEIINVDKPNDTPTVPERLEAVELTVSMLMDEE
jgi:hypothetical protein